METKKIFLIFAGCLCLLHSMAFANNDAPKDPAASEENLLDGIYESHTESTSSEGPNTLMQPVSKPASNVFPTQSYASYRQKHSFKVPSPKHILDDLNAMEKDLHQIKQKRLDFSKRLLHVPTLHPNLKKTLQRQDQNISAQQDIGPLKTIKDVLPNLTREEREALIKDLDSMTKELSNLKYIRNNTTSRKFVNQPDFLKMLPTLSGTLENNSPSDHPNAKTYTTRLEQ